jgi:hypothetical protein
MNYLPFKKKKMSLSETKQSETKARMVPYIHGHTTTLLLRSMQFLRCAYVQDSANDEAMLPPLVMATWLLYGGRADNSRLAPLTNSPH